MAQAALDDDQIARLVGSVFERGMTDAYVAGWDENGDLMSEHRKKRSLMRLIQTL